MSTRNGRIVREGMGGFLAPPTHPEHDYSIRYNGGCMALSGAADADFLDDETRAKARALLGEWKPIPMDHLEVKDWISQVLGYFENCYRGEGPEPECWYAGKLRIPPKDGTAPRPLDEHAGVHHIRKFYPEFAPTPQDFIRARWGTNGGRSKVERPKPEPVDDETSPLQRFIEKAGLKLDVREAESNPHCGSTSPMYHWSCTVFRLNPTTDGFSFPFSKGAGHVETVRGYPDRPIPPTLEEVLDCLASDAAGYENAPLFEDWAGEYGYDTDSRKAEKTFRTVQEQAARLKKFLGPALYNELLYDTERL